MYLTHKLFFEILPYLEIKFNIKIILKYIKKIYKSFQVLNKYCSCDI